MEVDDNKIMEDDNMEIQHEKRSKSDNGEVIGRQINNIKATTPKHKQQEPRNRNVIQDLWDDDYFTTTANTSKDSSHNKTHEYVFKNFLRIFKEFY